MDDAIRHPGTKSVGSALVRLSPPRSRTARQAVRSRALRGAGAGAAGVGHLRPDHHGRPPSCSGCDRRPRRRQSRVCRLQLVERHTSRAMPDRTGRTDQEGKRRAKAVDASGMKSGRTGGGFRQQDRDACASCCVGRRTWPTSPMRIRTSFADDDLEEPSHLDVSRSPA